MLGSDPLWKAESHLTIGGDKPADVYRIGRYSVHVFKDGTVAYRTATYSERRASDLPGIDIEDGKITIPVEDFVPIILRALTPVDLAIELWKDKDVREAFMDALAGDFETAVTQQDRNAFLARVKETVHNARLHRVAEYLRKLEYEVSQNWHLTHEIDRINRLLAHRDYRDAEGKIVQIAPPRFDPQFNIGGTAWNDARTHWREEIGKVFAEPDETKAVTQ